MLLEDDSSVSSGTSIKSCLSHMSSSSIELEDSVLDNLIIGTMHYAQEIQAPICNPAVIWGQQLTLDELSEDTCTDEFWFYKDNLKEF